MNSRRNLTDAREAKWKLLQIPANPQFDPCRFDSEQWLHIKQMPAQVHDILYEKGLLPEEYRVGWCKNVLWVSEYDWVYGCSFEANAFAKRSVLLFAGLDTFADVYLNGAKVGAGMDFYLPLKLDISDHICEHNTMYIHFHRICDELNRRVLPAEWEGAVMPCKMIRKPIHDTLIMEQEGASNYQGAVPGFTPIGVYGDIVLEQWETPDYMDSLDIRTTVSEDGKGIVNIHASGGGAPSELEVRIYPIDRKALPGDRRGAGNECREITVREKIRLNGGSWDAHLPVTVDSPLLWYPIGYGPQNRYHIAVFLKDKMNVIVHAEEKNIGFKRARIDLSKMSVTINGLRVRLYGGSMDPLQGYTHCYQPDRVKRLFEMAENAHMNTLRIWGEGIPQPDAFYEEADRRGFLIWQEFFMGNGAYPEDDEYVELCRKEAAELVSRLAHRVSILLWCGGNETIMGAEYAGVYPFGKKILEEVYPDVVRALDRERCYHPNSPYGGEWANDPRCADHHSYDCVWAYPYQEYPVFMSEHIRTAPPGIRSLRRMIKEFDSSWTTEDFISTYDSPDIWPEKWQQRTHLNASGMMKSAAYWEFYTPRNLEDALYNFGQSYAQEIRRYGEQIRRGKKQSDAPIRCQGYFACKLLDTWPKIYCASIDFFQEGFYPYYALEKLFRPVLLSFQKETSIRLWLVNDSPKPVKGRGYVGVYSIEKETFIYKSEIEAEAAQGDSKMVFDLSEYRFFPKQSILYAQILTDEGRRISCIDYMDIERHLRFKDAALDVSIDGDVLKICADHLVRGIEISGSDNGDEFGWLFSDNYFDLMPGQTAEIKILGEHKQGILTVKGHYLMEEYRVAYKGNTENIENIDIM